YSLRYMNINIFKNYPASAHASALLFQTGSEPVDFLDFKPRSHRASGPEPLLSRTPRSVWDCKGRNVYLKTKNIFLFFSFSRTVFPRLTFPPNSLPILSNNV